MTIITGLYGQFFIALRYFRSWQLIFALGLLLRILLLFVPTVLTTDIHRYLWEGHLLRNGVNPFQFAPDSVSLLPLHTEYWNRIEHAHLSAIYPPIAQFFFMLFARSEMLWRLFLIVVDCVNFFLLRRILVTAGVAPRLLCWYWLIPLSIIETAWSGHLDTLLVCGFIILWQLLQITPRTRTRAWMQVGSIGYILAATTMIKYVALFLLPYCLLNLWRRDALQAAVCLIIFCASSLIFSIPFLDSQLSMFTSLRTYLEHWRYNDSLFHLAGFIAGVDWGRSETFLWLKHTLFLLWAAICAILSITGRSFPLVASWIFCSYLLQASVVHPWYLLWVLPFIPAVQSTALRALCLTVILAYWPVISGESDVPHLIKLLEYLPVYALGVVELYRSRTGSRRLNLDSAF